MDSRHLGVLLQNGVYVELSRERQGDIWTVGILVSFYKTASMLS